MIFLYKRLWTIIAFTFFSWVTIDESKYKKKILRYLKQSLQIIYQLGKDFTWTNQSLYSL